MDYFENEKEKREKIIELNNDWKKQIATRDKIIFSDDNKPYAPIEYYNSDGFFPGYYLAKNRTLFIARESRYNSPCYTNGDRITTELDRFYKGINPNTSSYWRRILYMKYGIQNEGKYKFAEIPYAKEILDAMVKNNSFGFAIMNISKYSNDSEYGATADFNLINRFLKDSDIDKRNFFREEIEILNPDIIISANLWDGNINNDSLEKIFPSADFTNHIEIKGIADYWDFTFNGKTINFINLWHFSKMGSDEKLFYNPVIELLFNRSLYEKK